MKPAAAFAALLAVALSLCLTATADTDHAGECATECRPFAGLSARCKDPSVVDLSKKDAACMCTQEMFEALVQCGSCQAYQYAPYTGAFKGFVEIAIGECAALGFKDIAIDTANLPDKIDILPQYQMSQDTKDGLEGCMEMCNAVCDPEQVDDFDKDCVCTQSFFDSQFDCTRCAMDVTGNKAIELQVLKEAEETAHQCAAAGIKGLAIPTSLALKESPIPDVLDPKKTKDDAAVLNVAPEDKDKDTEAVDADAEHNDDSAPKSANTNSDLSKLLSSGASTSISSVRAGIALLATGLAAILLF